MDLYWFHIYFYMRQRISFRLDFYMTQQGYRLSDTFLDDATGVTGIFSAA